MNIFNGVKAIIFDCDGVIADTERAHYAAFAKALAREGIRLTWPEYCAKYLAMDDEGCIKQALKDRRQKTEVRSQNNGTEVVAAGSGGEALSSFRISLRRLKPAATKIKRIKAVKGKLYGQFLSKDRVKIYPGVKNFIKRLEAEGYPLAIASGSSRREVKFILKFSNLQPYFKVIIAAEDVRNGKPHPEAYKRALTDLNGSKGKVRPSQCLVIEDSIHGVQSAKRAGMKCLAVANTYPASLLARTGADLVVKSLKEVGTKFSKVQSAKRKTQNNSAKFKTTPKAKF